MLPWNQFEIDLDRHGLAAEAQLIQQVGDCGVLVDLTGVAVDNDLHDSKLSQVNLLLAMGHPVRSSGFIASQENNVGMLSGRRHVGQP